MRRVYPEGVDRFKGVSEREAAWIARLVYRALKKRFGLVPKSRTLTAYHTPMLLASTWMDAITARARTVPAVLLELAQLKVAALVGCPF